MNKIENSEDTKDKRCEKHCEKEEFSMEKTCNNCYENHNIQCHVTTCKYHSDKGAYCALNSIIVGTHEANPTMPECTDCQSFAAK